MKTDHTGLAPFVGEKPEGWPDHVVEAREETEFDLEDYEGRALKIRNVDTFPGETPEERVDEWMLWLETEWLPAQPDADELRRFWRMIKVRACLMLANGARSA